MTVPSRPKLLVSHEELTRRRGVDGLNTAGCDLARTAVRLRNSLNWRCGCKAFDRPEGDGFMYLPCANHDRGTVAT